MNHYDALIRDYLYEYKSVSFEKIGELVLDSTVSPDQPISKTSIHFTVSKRAVTTPELATFIAGKTGKSKVLINSDLESFVELMRQFINIGKPYEMEGVGIFKLGKSGEYEFAAFDETYTYKREETKSSKKQKSGIDSPLAVKNSSNKNLLMFFALIIILGVLGVIGWGTYKLFVNKNNTSAQTQTIADTATQTAPPLKPLQDSTAIKTDSLQTKDSIAVAVNDSASYKFIYETTTSSARAYDRVNTLRSFGHPSAVDSIKRDSVTVYTLYFKYRLSAADTAIMKDSLQKLLSRKIRIRPL
ncbi:hypothetical protein FRZ67_22985 [Panacibacter ginsenosidivorans]|uniref:CCDC81-like prokaryotic HU domain-containing protein n=1 Tax=Panacibacter ginsenosidivorans TaxID=1813871 RepID=A0A5B8VG67_9BACT|nr:hypothetical protein [Panacibacter ginsenosidivorans]QEC70025.1 hypothetical protein FRZ67_22985 [Panacibacter ginsenosidivorans]